LNENNLLVKIYPNPAKHFVTVEAEGIKEVSI
jgi:hypothetical protein